VRALVTLTVAIVAACAALAIGHFTKDVSPYPDLALDLKGGTQLILTPTPTSEGQRAITEEDITQAIAIIRNRIDASGVSESEISSMGSSNIMVSIPGTPSQEQLDLIRSSSQMNFRPVRRVGPAQGILQNQQQPQVDNPQSGAQSGAQSGMAFDLSGLDFGELSKDLPQLVELYARHGIKLIDNEHEVITGKFGSFTLVGAGDAYTDHAHLDQALKGAPEGFRFLLTHSPEILPQLEKADIDYAVCGHTHGGQVAMPFIGAIHVPGQGLFPKYSRGRYQVGKAALYIDSGVGVTGMDLRFLVQSQIVLHVFHP